MAQDDQIYRRDMERLDTRRRSISFGLNSIKNSFEEYFPGRGGEADPEQRKRWKRAILTVEDARVELMALNRRVSPMNDRSSDALLDARYTLNHLLVDEDFVFFSDLIRYRPLPNTRSSSDIYQNLLDPGQNILEVVKLMIEMTFVGEAFLGEDGKFNVRILRRIVPEQKIAPIQFKIEKNRLKIVEIGQNPKEIDLLNVEHSRNTIIHQGNRIIDELKQSNCDRRLLEYFSELHGSIISRFNIIKIGILNISCESISNSFKEELSVALQGMLLGHARAVAMYVAQFSEWRQFAENSDLAHLDDTDVRDIARAADQVIEDILKNPQIADPEVPKSIAALRALLEAPGTASRRVAYAVLRTIENLVAKVFEYGTDFIDQALKKTAAGLADTASKVLIGVLLVMALNGASGLFPVASKVTDMVWVRTAADILEKELLKLEK